MQLQAIITGARLITTVFDTSFSSSRTSLKSKLVNWVASCDVPNLPSGSDGADGALGSYKSSIVLFFFLDGENCLKWSGCISPWSTFYTEILRLTDLLVKDSLNKSSAACCLCAVPAAFSASFRSFPCSFCVALPLPCGGKWPNQTFSVLLANHSHPITYRKQLK